MTLLFLGYATPGPDVMRERMLFEMKDDRFSQLQNSMGSKNLFRQMTMN
jgi:hypothetical protein